MTVATKRFTLEEYLHYSDGTDIQYELVDGALLAMSQPSGLHEDITEFLFLAFKTEIQRLKLGLVAKQGKVAISSPRGTRWETCRVPDVVVVDAAQWRQMRDRESLIRLIDPPPQLVVEVVSPSTEVTDYRAKRSEYSVLDIPEYWIVDPLKGCVVVLTLEQGFYESQKFKGSDRIESLLFPELCLTAEAVLNANG